MCFVANMMIRYDTDCAFNPRTRIEHYLATKVCWKLLIAVISLVTLYVKSCVVAIIYGNGRVRVILW